MKKILYLVLVVMGMAFVGRTAQAQVVVIANPSIKSADVSKADLKDVFTGAAPSLKDGSHAVPVLLKSGAVNDEFLSAYIGKTDAAFKASWRSMVFSGQGSMPKTVDSDAAMVEYVAHTPGAIGFVGKGSPHEGVKVLTVK
jgi:ABC-type phosphate transport system substrate-binding protein